MGGVLLVVAVAGSACGQSISLDPPVYLPDGSEFKTWVDETSYHKTYWVDRHHPEASDENPGTSAGPFKTIGRAAEVVQAGQRVLIRSGVYREQITPRFGGNGPDAMISYEAAPGARVVVKGSRVVPSPWKPSRHPGQFSEKLWMTTLPASLFEQDNPFAIENASAEDIAIMPWAREWAGRVPYTLKRGLIFQDSRRLAQLATYEDLVRVPGSYWVASDGLTLHIHPLDDANPNDALMEVTVQQHLLKPDVTDLGYIRIKGLTFMHVGNGYPRTGVGAIFTMGGHHWIIEDNKIAQVGSVGIEIGTRSLESPDRQASRTDSERARLSPGYIIVRNNDISQCGTGGIQGLAVRRALVEGNCILHCGWQDVERYWETAGIKLLINEKTLVRRNVIGHFTAGSAIWLDWDNKNSRVTQNLVYNIWMCCNGALFVEASQTPNMIDHNILWDIRGTGIYAGDSDNLIIAHNLVGPCTGPGVHTRVATSRHVNGRPVTSRDNHVIRNVFYRVAEPIRFEDARNDSEDNVFADPAGTFDLAAWQTTGRDGSSVTMEMDMAFDPARLELTWNSPPLPQRDALAWLDLDYYNGLRPPAGATCGPFQDRFAELVVLNVRPTAERP
jgi:hypothetical protein